MMNNPRIINLNEQRNIEYTLFPDNADHVNVTVREGEDVIVICSITRAQKMMQLMLTANAITHAFGKKKILYIPYLMGARYDRIMKDGDSFDLEVIANMINSMGFEKVILLDPHSDVACALIKNSVAINNKFLVEQYQEERGVLIIPDAGAAKKVSKYLQWSAFIQDVVFCAKERDLATGSLVIKVLNPEKCEGRNCVIIDDLCDAGGTFLGIASQIKPQHLTLMVTHGLFSKGVNVLSESFQRIITTNSTQRHDAGQYGIMDVTKADELWLR
jgi:ribose-phosphate pyrophosphokinase